MLVQLEKPQSLEYILDNTVFHPDEINYEIEALIDNGFVAVQSGAGLDETTPLSAPEDRYHLDDEIILSKAKFLLIDFCVDSFGTRSEAFSDEIRACKSAQKLSQCLKNIVAAAQAQCPDVLPTLKNVVDRINETAA